MRNSRWFLAEDWLSVWLGAATIVLVLAGLRPALPVFKWTGLDASPLFSASNLGSSLLLCLGCLAISLPGALVLGARAGRYLAAFPAVFALAWTGQAIAGNKTMNGLGLEYVIFALALGLMVSNLFGTPEWMREAVRTEYFIKTGLVIMGATILFEEILQAGALGILQAVFVVIVVWYFTFWLSRRLKVDDEFGAMLATSVSICGVSAAIAACGAIQGDKKKLSYVASVVLIVAIPMMVLQPWMIKTLAIPDIVGGAWLGGTLDTTGSVVAAGALISESAMKVGTIVKFSQNVLIGIAAFFLSVWWTMRQPGGKRERPTAAVIWERFPKFVLGFVAASLVFSFLLPGELVKETKSTLSGLRTVWFALAFASIGLETRFTDLLSMGEGRPLFAFLGGQAVNLAWTLILAWLIFGGVFFSVPVFQ
jgi:uncharacterized integral membrane protein (TIGR00698 family)